MVNIFFDEYRFNTLSCPVVISLAIIELYYLFTSQEYTHQI
jgi:hypothetical protein